MNDKGYQFREGLTGLLLALLGLFYTSVPASAAPTCPPLTSFLYGNSSVNAPGKTNLVSGTGYGYRYLLPKNFNAANKYPLIIFLHGIGEVGTDNVKQLSAGGNNANGALYLVSTANPDNQTAYPCFFVAPQTPTGTWSDAAGAQAVSNILITLETQYPNAIDVDRVCLTGLSLGGMGTFNLPTMIKPNPFCCIVPQSGNAGNIGAEPAMPVWAFHAANDPTVGVSGSDNAVDSLRNRGLPVVYTRYNTGGHGIWSTAYAHPLLLPWIFAQRRGQPMQGVPGLTLTGSSQGTNLNLSGTATTGASFARVGWSSSRSSQGPTLTNGVGNGTTTFTCASASFTSDFVGQRLSLGTGPVYCDIVGVVDALSATVAAGTYTFITYPYGTKQNPYPATGNISPSWNLTNIALLSGANVIQAFGEALSGSSLGGRTTVNQSFSVNYTAPATDKVPPSLAILSPNTNAVYNTTHSTLDLSGTASDNIGVTQVTWRSSSGASGSAVGTNNWSVAGIVIGQGANVITVSARDAASNIATASFTVSFSGILSQWRLDQFGTNVSNLQIAGDSADPDGDKIPNLVEYALGGNPTTASVAILPVGSRATNRLQLRFSRPAPSEVIYIVEASTDLTNWTAVATLPSNGSAWTGTAAASETGTGSNRNVTVQDAVATDSKPQRFLRLKITNP